MKNTTFNLTENQKEALSHIQEFINSNNDIFILTGAAGTGKTTVIKNIIESVHENVSDIVLLAPTNRAVKVLSKKTEIQANTVHSEIYSIKEIKNSDGIVLYNLLVPKILSIDLNNVDKDANEGNILFIVDESSMLSATPSKDGALVSKNSLLEDFCKHVKYFGSNNKILFVGDSYQLPPIGHEGIAPALDKTFMNQNFSVKTQDFELTTILRQDSDSYILKIAQDIKNRVDQKQTSYNLKVPNTFLNYHSFIQNYVSNFDPTNPEKTIALAWTRKSVLQMNLDIRKLLFGKNVREIEVGDMVSLNERYTKNNFEIQKGEIGKVVEVVKRDGVKGDLLFHTVKIEFTGIDNLPFYITTKVLTDLLYTHEDIISKEIFIKLAIERSKENAIYKKSKNPNDDDYMSALQLKFSYALTVHKSQGGEWKNVFLHRKTNWTDLRWNYTAVTRASKELYSFGW